ncbi:unnamed protein product [Porites lobata]|uniref:PHD-type domain-containing protein n=1 Tax=Porites lobata TaxID=104759 RepID=A0ABN8RS46_9CNID|nr:unnamed protein product [Porites lobata]
MPAISCDTNPTPRSEKARLRNRFLTLSVFVCYYMQCSECDPSDDDDEMEVDTEDTTPISQGRQRRVIKEPTKFTPDKGEKPKLEESSAPAAKRGRRPGRRSIEPPEKKKKPEDSRTECCVCKQSGTNSNLVRCDQCKLCYHFQCLDPPIKANPKTRGYLWFCTECDESEEESDEDVDVEDMSTTDAKTEKYDKETEQKNSEKNEKNADEGKDEGDKSVKKDKKKKEEGVEDQNKAAEKDMQTNVNKAIKEKEEQKGEFEKADQSKKVDGSKKKVDSREAEDVERSSKEPKNKMKRK